MSQGLCWLSYTAIPEAEVRFELTMSVLQTNAFNHLATQPFGSPDETCTRNLQLEEAARCGGSLRCSDCRGLTASTIRLRDFNQGDGT